jgi:hypothetical protein
MAKRTSFFSSAENRTSFPQYSVEQSIIEGKLEVKELFEYAQNNAAQFEAYEMERAIFARVMQIGLAAMKSLMLPRYSPSASKAMSRHSV